MKLPFRAALRRRLLDHFVFRHRDYDVWYVPIVSQNSHDVQRRVHEASRFGWRLAAHEVFRHILEHVRVEKK